MLLGFLPEPERRLAEGIAFVQEYAGSDGLVTPLLSPHSLYTCTREQWEAWVWIPAPVSCAACTTASKPEPKT